MNLFDAHVHLQDERLAADRGGVVARAMAAGVTGMVCCGCTAGDWAAVAELADRVPGLIPAFGVHPWYVAGQPPDWLERLAGWLERHPAAGVGEVGLDHAVAERDDVRQAEYLAAQLALARARGRPVSVHCRRAWAALADALREAGPLPAGFVVHAYSGGIEFIDAVAAAGGYFSFSGSLTYPGNRRGAAAAAAVPAERLLIETDAPDMAPWVAGVRPDRTVPNEPANLPVVARRVAELRGMDVAELAALTARNARRLFGIAGVAAACGAGG